MSNKNLNNAKKIKNDEYYTRYKDIKKELTHYKPFLKGRDILLPCEVLTNGIDAGGSFVEFFRDHAATFEIGDVKAYGYVNGEGVPFQESLPANSKHSHPVVITNPPFSVLNEFIDLLTSLNYDYIILIPLNRLYSIYYAHLIAEGHAFIGFNTVSKFYNINGDTQGVPCVWLTSFNVLEQRTELKKGIKSIKEPYYKLPRSEILWVDKVQNIPPDYEGFLAVPGGFFKTTPVDYVFYGNYKVLGNANKIYKQQTGERPKYQGREIFQRVLVQKVKNG